MADKKEDKNKGEEKPKEAKTRGDPIVMLNED